MPVSGENAAKSSFPATLLGGGRVGGRGLAAVPGPRSSVSGSLRVLSPPSPGSILLSASLERQCFLLLSGHQPAALEFSGHLLLNCVPIERNTITLGGLRAIVNTCSLPSCSMLAWSVSLERVGKASLGGG